MFDTIRRLLWPPSPGEESMAAEDAAEQMGELARLTREQIAQTRAVRREVQTVRERLEAGAFPLLGEPSGSPRSGDRRPGRQP